MLDGAPFCRLQQNGVPSNSFWPCCQKRYAKLFGAMRLGNKKPRRDIGMTHNWVNSGKTTMAAIRRSRAKAMPTLPSPSFGMQKSGRGLAHGKLEA